MNPCVFTSFIQGHVAQGDESFTHVSQMKPVYGRYSFTHTDMDMFWQLYCEELAKGVQNFKYGLSEKPHQFGPVLGDIDISVPYDSSKNYDLPLYTSQHVQAIVEIYQSVLRYVVREWDEKNITCFVLEKRKPYRDNARVKHGFHIHFPFLFLSNTDQEIHVSPRVRQDVEKANLFADIGIEHSGETVDKNITAKYWLMYGCRKRVDMESYMVTKIFDFKGEPITLETAMEGVVFRDTNDKSIKRVHPPEWYLPMLLSINPNSRPECIKACVSNIDVEVVKKRLSKGEDIKGNYEAMTMVELIVVVDKLVAMLAEWRANDYAEWMKIGWTIFNIVGGCREGFEIWCKFSQRTTKGNYSEAVCIHQWNKMTKRNMTLGSLRFFAQTDNPEAYKAFTEQTRMSHMKEILHGQTPLAKQLYECYGQYFVLADLDKNLWFEFMEGLRWKQTQQGMRLRQRIHTDLVPIVRQKTKEKLDEDMGEKVVQAQEKQWRELLVKLNSNSYKNGIMNECKEFFHSDVFLAKLDGDPMILGFDNGVLDLRSLEFRCGRPDDYCSMTVGYAFKEYNDNDPEVLEVQDFLLKIFPDENLRRYFLEYAARLLPGKNTAKTFLAMTGEGDNGKSMSIELIEKALGVYSIKFPTSLITGKRTQSSQASPELARAHGVRFAVVQEPDTGDYINAGVLKELTGNDKIYVRGLFSDGRDVEPFFKMCLVCNKLPRISSEETAIWNRLLVLPFESRFPKNNAEVPKTFQAQLAAKTFYRDPMLSEKLSTMKEAFMWLMFKTYKECVSNGWSPIPDKVKNASQKYRENNDLYLQFINECTKRDPQASVTLNEIYENFKAWVQQTFNSKPQSKNELRDELARRWGPMLVAGQKWVGYRMRTALDDEQDGKILVLRDEDVSTTDNEADDEDGDF